MPSKAEGLSIAILEAISYGLPIIMFADSECAYDLDNEKVVMFAKDRGDEALGESICNWYNKVWDKPCIKTFARKFTLEHMAQEYIDFYNKVLLEKK